MLLLLTQVSRFQDALYAACDVDSLIESVLQGYSQTVFAFGQTGSGKTHSICGPSFSHQQASTATAHAPESVDANGPFGLLEQAAVCSFRKASESSSRDVKIDMTCLEIYQEQVTDLLVSERSVLPVRHHPSYGFYVQGLTQRECRTREAYKSALNTAFHRRKVASHSLNDLSTRSHVMITLQFTTKSRGGGASSDNSSDEGMDELPTYGRLCFVDLAGSERLGDTESNSSAAVTRAETGSINKSLFALGQVISMLGSEKRQKSRSLVPFRDSKLTQLLMDW